MMSKWLIPIYLILLLIGCSTYRVSHREYQDGKLAYETKLVEVVPPGGKKLSEGAARIQAQTDGSWTIAVGAKAQTDATGTGEMVVDLATLGYKIGLAAASGGLSTDQASSLLKLLTAGMDGGTSETLTNPRDSPNISAD
jgi:hypothetical protein